MRTLLALGVLVSVTYVACGNDDDDGELPMPEAPGSGGEGDHGSSGGAAGSSTGGSGPSTAGEAGKGSAPGGNGPGLWGDGGGAAEGGAAEGGAAGEATSGTAGSAGRPEEPPGPLNGCAEFVDGRSSAELRTIPWGYSLGHYPSRCLLVQVGQAVAWQGAFGSHPIQPAGGTMPSPIVGDTLSDQTSYEVRFDALGTYGYECGLHASMRGAIRVVD